MLSGQVLKADKDFTKEVDKQLPEAQQLAKVCIQSF
jgi:26S proteasome regulatory subunit N5